jgi:hypothetical protein
MKVGYGNKEGDMKVDVMEGEYPASGYAGNQEGKTNDYVSRQNRMIQDEAQEIKNKNYRGRYE